MAQYTELLDKKAEELLLDDDDYEERLLEVATLFRGFDEAFTSFIKEHGYTGDLSDTPAKVEFLRDKFKAVYDEEDHRITAAISSPKANYE